MAGRYVRLEPLDAARHAADLFEAGRTDDLKSTINYSDAFRIVKGIVEDRRFKLLEALGEAICSALLTEFALAEQITVTIRKPGVAIKGSILDASGVTIRRGRTDMT